MAPKDRLELLKLLQAKKQIIKANRLDYVNYSLYPEQTEAIRKALDRAIRKVGPKFVTIFGGNQSGKTEAGTIVESRVFEELADARILSATVETRLQINVQQRKLNEYLRGNNILYGNYNGVRGYKNNVIIGNNGSTISFKTYKQGYEAFQGDEYDLIHLDEEPPWDIFQECIMRTVKRNGCILLTFTSLQGFTKIVNFLWESDNPEVWTCILDLLVNPYIPQTNKDIILLTIDPDEIESRIHGKPHIKTGLIYKEYGQIHKCADFDYIQEYKNDPSRFEISEGIDPHTRTPHHWVRFFYDKKDDVLYIVDELKAPIESMRIADFSRLIKIKRQKITPVYCQIDTSASAQIPVQVKANDEQQDDTYTIRSEFLAHDVETILCVKDNQMGIGSVKDRLKCVKTINGDIKRYPKLYVFNSCSGVNWEFSRYSWDSYLSSKTAEKKEVMNQPYKKDDHFMDIIKYEGIKRMRNIPEEQQNSEEERFKYMGY